MLMAVVRTGRFLWRLIPGDGLRIYKWTGKNDYVALCEPEYLSFGGGCVSYPVPSPASVMLTSVSAR